MLVKMKIYENLGGFHTIDFSMFNFGIDSSSVFFEKNKLRVHNDVTIFSTQSSKIIERMKL